MPAMAPVNGVIKFRFTHHVGSDLSAMTHLYFQTFQAPTSAQAGSAASAASASWNTNFATLCPAQWSLVGVSATDLSSQSGPVGIDNTTHAGTRASPPNPGSTCTILNLPIGRRYRGGKPRVYWPFGVNNDLATPQSWTSGYITQANAAWLPFATAILTNLQTWSTTARLVSVSYYQGHNWLPDQNGNYHRVPVPRTTPLVDPVVGTATFNLVPGSQRRRLRPG